MQPETRWTPENLAEAFHRTYELLAPSYGYETRQDSAVPWSEVPEQNRALMIATCRELLTHGHLGDTKALRAERDEAELRARRAVQRAERAEAERDQAQGGFEQWLEVAHRYEMKLAELGADLDTARAHLSAREGLETAARWLLALKDGPRDSAYEIEKPEAWIALRQALPDGPSVPPVVSAPLISAALGFIPQRTSENLGVPLPSLPDSAYGPDAVRLEGPGVTVTAD